MSHLLLVDDDPLFISEQLRALFPQPTHRVSVVQNGNAGVEAVRASAPAPGGHFAAWEQPKLFVDELRASFRPLRSNLKGVE
jgi:CheY-like chemotaxis protein